MADIDAIRLIVGLGNPGLRYERTRHNAGFWFVDALASVHGGRFHSESKFDGETVRLVIDGSELRLFKPMTFMNRSGRALRLIGTFYKIPLPNILVAHDEIDLPCGVARLKRGGGHGGHNGLRDVVTHVGTDVWRLRLGVGHPGHKDEVVGYVLSNPREEEQKAILASVHDTVEIVPRLVAGEFERAMQQLHTRQTAV